MLLEALDMFKRERVVGREVEGDTRKTIVLVDGKVPANFGIVSS
jgi:hypothetical protein